MNNEIAVVIPAVQEAGAAIIDLQQTGFTVMRKTNNDLLTQADLLANTILKQHIMSAFPKDGWLSEESVDDSSRLMNSRVWIVDPIDGTKEFVNSIPEYAISVALIENGRPIVACVYNPIKNELFHAVREQGAWLNQTKIHCDKNNTSDFLLLASRSEYQRGEWDKFKKRYRVEQVGSIAYKLALVAAGAAQATFSLGPKSEWDIAAGALLVEEAGGIVTDKEGHPLVFNQKNVLVNGIVATTADANKHILAMLGAR